VKRNRFVELSDGIRTVSGELEAQARALAGLPVYITGPADRPGGTPVTAEFVIGACYQVRTRTFADRGAPRGSAACSSWHEGALVDSAGRTQNIRICMSSFGCAGGGSVRHNGGSVRVTADRGRITQRGEKPPASRMPIAQHFRLPR
jgi:hypothetical protein